MKREKRLLVGLLVGGMAWVAAAADRPPAAARASARVVSYYFHRTIRCETCLRIEKQAHEVITNRFAFEVAAERLAFKAVNYEQPENAHFREDYELGGPSLVLVRQKGGKDVERKVLGQTWDFAHIPPKLDLYIEEETRKFLEGEKLPAGDRRVSTNSATSGQGLERKVGKAVGN